MKWCKAYISVRRLHMFLAKGVQFIIMHNWVLWSLIYSEESNNLLNRFAYVAYSLIPFIHSDNSKQLSKYSDRPLLCSAGLWKSEKYVRWQARQFHHHIICRRKSTGPGLLSGNPFAGVFQQPFLNQSPTVALWPSSLVCQAQLDDSARGGHSIVWLRGWRCSPHCREVGAEHAWISWAHGHEAHVNDGIRKCHPL